jgi:hypothetical protein
MMACGRTHYLRRPPQGGRARALGSDPQTPVETAFAMHAPRVE